MGRSVQIPAPHHLGDVLDRIEKPVASRTSSKVAIHFVESAVSGDVAAAWLSSARQFLLEPLAQRGMATSSGPALLPGAINLATAACLSRLWLPYFRSFMVGLRADPAQLAQCDWEIVPEGLDAPGSHRSAISPWSNQATLARDPSRLDRVTNLAFLSVSPALSRWRDARQQVEQLLQLGVSCRVESAALSDLSEIDVLVADGAELRRAGNSFSSPLVTAWRAGIPAILIDTEQQRCERSSALDYLSIGAPEELAETVAQLQSHPQLYEAMRQRCAERARELRDNLITRRWIETLTERITPLACSTLEQRRSRPVRAMSLQAGRWLVQQGRRHSRGAVQQPASGAS